jgi:hypothetical protein
MEDFNPISGWKTGLEHEQAHNVISGTNDVLSAPILGRGVWVGHTHGYTMGEKKSACASVVKLPTVITLDGLIVLPNCVRT